jgi:hypothetical protein
MDRVEEVDNVEQDEETRLKRPHGRPWEDQETLLVDSANPGKYIGTTSLNFQGAVVRVQI